jgi:hypothetical protein
MKTISAATTETGLNRKCPSALIFAAFAIMAIALPYFWLKPPVTKPVNGVICPSGSAYFAG